MQTAFDFNRLGELLSDVLSGDNEKIKLATSQLKKFTKTAECVEPLATIITNSPNPQYRQLASVLLKRNGIKLYSELDQEKQSILKNVLIERYFAESVKLVRNSLSTLIGQIVIESEQILRLVEARIEQSTSVEDKEKAILLLGSIVEFSGGRLKDYFSNLLPFFQTCLNEAQPIQVRLATLKCFLHVIESSDNLTSQTTTFLSPLLPAILHLLPSSLLTVHSSDLFVLSLDIFTDLAEMKSPLITPHLATIIEFILSPTVIFNNELPLRVKETGLDFILVVSEQNRKVLSKDAGLLKKVIKDIVGLCALPFKKEEEEEESLQDVALWLIESLSVSLPNKAFYHVIMTEIGVLLQSVSDQNKLNTAYLILAAITKGCQSKVRKALPDIMKQVMPLGLSHSSPKVRGAAIAALAYLSEHLIPEIIDYHSDIIPFLLGALDDVDKKVVEKALFAINIFCENMEGLIEVYLDKVMPALAIILMNEKATNFMRTIAFVTLGACVTSAEKKFYPYLEDSLKVITSTIFKKSSTDIHPIQAAAIQTLGKIVLVFYPDTPILYSTYILPSIEHIFNIMQTLDDFEIREAGLCFFYHIASALQQEFASLIDKVTNFAITIANSESGVSYESSKKDKDFSLDTDSDEENQTGSAAKVNMSFLDEKAAAIHALGEFAQACPNAFAGFIERSIDTLEGTIDYFNDNIRTQTVICYKDLAESIVKAANGGVIPKYKPGFPLETNLSSQNREYLNIISEKLVHSLENDDSPEVITTAIDALTILCKSIGPVIIEKTAQDIIENIQKRLKSREKELKNEGEETEENLMIFEYLTDLIPGLAKAFGSGFGEAWKAISPYLLASLSKDRDSDEYIQVVGCLGLIFKYAPQLLDSHLSKIIAFFEARVPEKDDEVNRNISYCLGIICEKRPDLMIPRYEQVSLLLKSILNSADFLEARENVLAAFCRMVMVSEKLSIDDIAKVCANFNPIHQELVKNVFAFLPFKGDFEEEKTILKYIIFLFKKDEKSVMENLEKISEILLDGIIHFKKYNLSDKFLTKIIPIIKNVCIVNQEIAVKIQNIVMSLNESEKNRVINLLK